MNMSYFCLLQHVKVGTLQTITYRYFKLNFLYIKLHAEELSDEIRNVLLVITDY